MKRIGILTWLVLILNLTPRAQTDSVSSLPLSPVGWTFEQCLQHAAINNLSLKKAALELDQTKIKLENSKLSRLPSLVATAGQSLSNGNSIDPITSDYISQSINSTNYGISSSVVLYNGNQITTTIEKNRLLVNQQEYLFENEKNSIKLAILQAYLQTLYSKDGITIADSALAAANKQMVQAQALYEARSITLSDLVESESQLANKRYELIQAKKEYQTNLLELRQLLEIEPESEFDIMAINKEAESDAPITDKMLVYKEAIQKMPQIQASKVNMEVAGKNLKIAKSGYYPSISLSGSLGSGYTSSQDYTFSSQATGNFNQKIGLNVSIPLFNQGQTKSQVQSSKIALAQAELTISESEKALYKNIETAWLNATAASEQKEAARISLDAASSAYELAAMKFAVGNLTATDLILAQSSLTQAEQNLNRAIYLSILYSRLLSFYKDNQISL